jgi:hypothetical protein
VKVPAASERPRRAVVSGRKEAVMANGDAAAARVSREAQRVPWARTYRVTVAVVCAVFLAAFGVTWFAVDAGTDYPEPAGVLAE